MSKEETALVINARRQLEEVAPRLRFDTRETAEKLRSVLVHLRLLEAAKRNLQ